MACNRSREENLHRAAELLHEAARRKAQIACLPELFCSDYFCQTEDHENFAKAEPIPGPTTEAIGQIARETKMVVLASLFERRAAGLYHNTCAVMDADGELLGRYRKMHIPDDPQYFEKFYFTPGDLGFQAFPTRYARIGTLVCWDQWYPEAARLTAMKGAEILFYPTAIGWFSREKQQWGTTQHASWRLIQQSHAVANGCYVAAVNRIGHEPCDGKEGIEFWGQSFICDTNGMILAEASVDKEEVIVAEVDLGQIDRTRTAWPFFRDRRIDAYDEILNRFSI
jgi:N-carbamoylputrescine amidase